MEKYLTKGNKTTRWSKPPIPKTANGKLLSRQVSSDTQNTWVSLSNLDSKISQALKLRQTISADVDQISTRSLSWMTMSVKAPSVVSRPFSTDILPIPEWEGNRNTRLETISYEQRIEDDTNSQHTPEVSFALKNDVFNTCEDLNKSSPIKAPKGWFGEYDDYLEELNKEIERDFNNSTDELISVQDEFQLLHSQTYGLDLTESRKKFDRLTSFKKNTTDKAPSPILKKSNESSALKSQISEKISSKKDKEHVTKAKSSSNSKERAAYNSVEDIISLFSTQKSPDIKHTETREQLSDRVSKFYFQQQTGFANQNDAYSLVRKNLYPTFLNDPEADKQRVRSREQSCTKENQRIVTPSKIIMDMFERHGSTAKKSFKSPSPQREEPDIEPLKEFWDVMNKDLTRDVKKERKEDMIKKMFIQRALKTNQ